VILMGVAHLDAICGALQAAGLAPETPVAVVADAGSATMRVVRGRLSDITSSGALAGIEPPAVTVIGGVADLDLWTAGTRPRAGTPLTTG
jgi:siroheme synthase